MHFYYTSNKQNLICKNVYLHELPVHQHNRNMQIS